MSYHWNWQIFLEPVSTGRGTYLDWLLSGLCWTLAVALVAWVLALALGVVLGVVLTGRSRVARWSAIAYCETFRGVPLLVQMFLWYFVLPELLPAGAAHWLKREMPLPEAATAALALAAYTASRIAVLVRAGIESVPRGLREAGAALGLRGWATYQSILLPICLRTMTPTLTSEFMSLVKNTSIALTIGVMELTAQARAVTEYTFHGFESFAAATLLYLVIVMIVGQLMRRVEARSRIVGMLTVRT